MRDVKEAMLAVMQSPYIGHEAVILAAEVVILDAGFNAWVCNEVKGKNVFSDEDWFLLLDDYQLVINQAAEVARIVARRQASRIEQATERVQAVKQALAELKQSLIGLTDRPI